MARVTTVIRDQKTPTTLQIDLLTKAETLDFLPDYSRWDSTSLYLVPLEL
jgi:hypothetical protein